MLKRSIVSVLVRVFAVLVLLSPSAAQAQTTLSINDVSQSEGDSGTTVFTFTVSLSAPAGPGGVTFDIATAANTATADVDYFTESLTGQTIPSGSVLYAFDVVVNGDTTPEPNETFFVNVTNITGADVGDAQGVGTILNDDVTITPIHDIQGPGASSPIVGSTVTLRGIVTGVKANGFFVQEEEAEYDADPATSEGIFVFTASAPPAAAVVGALVQVTGTVAEFVPSNDPQAPWVTEITSPTVVQLGVGQALPSAIPLSPTFPAAAGPFDQLERVEHMRVSVASLTVTGPSAGAVDEPAATGASNGRFHGVITGVPRPFREPGIQEPDIAPTGNIPPIPRWDSNPERIRVDSAGLIGQPALTVKSGDVVGPLAGPLDYSSRTYAIQVDNTVAPVVTPGTLPTMVSSQAANDITVASVNLRRLYDTVDDPYADPVLSAPAYDRRLSKAAIAIGDHLRGPDIVGVQEVENLTVLSDLAARIHSLGGPQYAPFLIEGNDASGLDVGVLVKTEPVTGGIPRVSNVTVTQLGAGVLWSNPATGGMEILYDRPPLVVHATVNRSSSASFPLAVIVTDLLGLGGIDSQALSGPTTIGNEVRRRRQTQAEFLANDIQSRQIAEPSEPLIVVGGFNAFEMNDGYVDVVNTLTGTPPPDDQTVVPDGMDLVNPDLVNLATTPAPAERYSEVADGNARNVDHVLVNAALVAATSARRIEHPRIAADYPETHVSDDATALRFSDHDPVVAYLSTAALAAADLQVTNVGAPNPVPAGQHLTYTITVTNAGPDTAGSVTLSDTLPTETPFVSLTAPGGWSCTTPAVGASGTVSCSMASLSAGSATFTLTVAVSPAIPAGTIVPNMASVAGASTDPTPGNNSALAEVIVDGAPQITDIANVTAPEDVPTPPLPFVIGDVATPAASLVVTAASSDQLLVPDANIVLGGTGALRTVTVTPAANRYGGPVTITVTVSDGLLTATDTFTLTVMPVNDAPTIGTITDQSVDANLPLGPLSFTVDDVDDDAAGLTVSASSSNQTLVPDAAIVLGGTGTSRTLTITPVADQTGQATITLTVSDGEAPASMSFVLTVTPGAPATQTYYLAEGATGEFFDEDLLIANPNATEVPVTVTFYREGLSSVTMTRTIPAESGTTLRVDELPGLEAAAVSVQVTSENGLPLAVERTQFWGAGSYGGHTESALPAPATRWYFAEGAQGYFDTFVLVANPQAEAADVTLTFLREADTSVTTTVQVAPFSRATISAATIPDLANRTFAIIVDATQPVVAERAMYLGSTATRPWSGGGAAAGVTAPATSWYFAEGATGTFFDTFILLMNPEAQDAHVTLRYMLATGETIDVPKLVPAGGRLTVGIESETDERLHGGSMATLVTSDRPIVAERSVYWPTDEAAQPWGESHTSQGATAAAPRWALAEGRTGGALNFHTYVLLANPGTEPAEATVRFLPESGTPVVKTYVVPPTSRITLDVTSEAPELQDRSFITLIDTAGNVPIIVERSMYWDGAGLPWSGGSNASGTRLPE